jgi:RNA polymerase sigma-70 factor (ECF subfamily)
VSNAEFDVAASLEAELDALWRFAMRITANNDDASDLVQRTCVRALEKRSTYTPNGKFRSWLFQIQHRIWLNELRSRKMRIPMCFLNKCMKRSINSLRHNVSS